jgi:hypothetical protein
VYGRVRNTGNSVEGGKVEDRKVRVERREPADRRGIGMNIK